MRRKLAIDPRQIEHRCNRTHLVIVRHHLFKAERIKQLSLVLLQPTHHGPFPPLTASTSGNHCSRKPSTDFCNKIGTKRTCRSPNRMSAFGGRADVSHGVFYEYTAYPYISALFTDFRISEISLANGPKSAIYPLPSRPPEGRLAIVTDAGRDAVDAGSALDERCWRVRPSRGVLGP